MVLENIEKLLGLVLASDEKASGHPMRKNLVTEVRE